MALRILIAVALGTFFGASAADAVVPSGRSMIRRVAERQALDRVTASPLVGSAQVPGRAAPSSVRLELTLPGTCKAQLESPEGRASLSYSAGKLTNQGAPYVAMEAAMALACPLIALKNAPASDAEASLEKLLSSWGVDLGTSSLGLLDGHPSVVIGAKPRELSKPQVWVDKTTDRVVRVIGTYGGKHWDIRFEDPVSIGTNRLAPRVTHVWQNKALELTLQLMALEPKVSGPAALPSDSSDDAE